MRGLVFGIVMFILAACSPKGDVYAQPLPENGDTEALIRIRDNIKPEDREAWSSVMMARMNPMATAIDSKTVGEAITKRKARTGCMEANDTSKVPENKIPLGDPRYEAANSAHIAAYNRVVAAYNACSKMPL